MVRRFSRDVPSMMEDVQKTETSEEKGFKKRATEILVKGVGMIGK